MSRNSKNRHRGKGTSAQNGNHGASGSGSRSLSTFRADRAVDALTPAFVDWFDDGSVGAATAALECLVDIKAVMGRYMDSTAAADVTGFEPIALAIAITDVLVAAAEEEDAVFVVDSVHAYIDFLTETDRWRGSPEQLAGITDFFETVEDADLEPGIIDVPEMAEDQVLEVLSGLPLIQRATALLQWLGTGKPITGTGALRLKDIEPAAACVGITVRGAAKPADPKRHGVSGPVPDNMPTVRTMYEVPLLARIWAVLEDTELIAMTSTRAIPTADAEGFLAGHPPERLEEYSYFIARFLEHAVLGAVLENPWERPVAGLQASILIAASTPEPPLVERVLAAPDHAPEAEKQAAGLLTRMAVARLESLAELGLLTIDTHFRVPPAVVASVADVFDNEQLLEDLGLAEVPDDPDPEPAHGKAHTPGRKAQPANAQSAKARPAVESVLQLKIMLQDSKPPIWRRVLVPSNMPLDKLHEVIQALFGWLDYHLHHFQTDEHRGPTYAPVDPDGEDDSYGEPSLDESAVTLGELTPEAGNTMTYTYDFGDNWRHVITVEKVLKADDGGQLPRCTGGRGAAPAEDSGGTWGWATVVEAANDPDHEEHEQYREWLGLQPGETLDPKAFNIEEANEELTDLV